MLITERPHHKLIVFPINIAASIIHRQIKFITANLGAIFIALPVFFAKKFYIIIYVSFHIMPHPLYVSVPNQSNAVQHNALALLQQVIH